MKKVYSHELPYANTTISVEQSKHDIAELLAKNGIDTPLWLWEPPEHIELVFTLGDKFVVRLRARDVWKRIVIKGYGKGEVRNVKQVMRLIHWFVKDVLALYKWGYPLEQILMPFIAVKQRDGAVSTVSQAILPHLQRIALQPTDLKRIPNLS